MRAVLGMLHTRYDRTVVEQAAIHGALKPMSAQGEEAEALGPAGEGDEGSVEGEGGNDCGHGENNPAPARLGIF